MSDVALKPALELGRLLREGKMSSRELLAECLKQHAAHNTRINAVVVANVQRAEAAALAADKRIAQGETLSPFDGVPMTAKESFDWAGHASTWGDPALRQNIPTQNAVALQRMIDAGAVMYGKTNVPLHLTDWQSFNEVYGTTNNPWDVTRTPGGSSGGAAASLAAGMAALEIGSDIGNSIRGPAHYCGVYGHKPTFGVVPYRGHMMPGSIATSDITVAGPMARSASDLAAMMHVLAGPDQEDARAYAVKLPAARPKSWKDLRVAVKLTSTVSEVDQPYTDELLKLCAFLEPRVAKLAHAAPDFSDDEAYENFILLLRATATKRMSDTEISTAAERAKSPPASDSHYVSLMHRAFAMSHGEWLRQNERRHQLRLKWEAFFEDYDVLLCPCAASAAFPHDHVGERHERLITVNGKRVSTIDQRFWAGYAGNFYLPATAAPIGFLGGLPVGVQIITRAFDDLTSIKVAEMIEADYHRFQPPPGV